MRILLPYILFLSLFIVSCSENTIVIFDDSNSIVENSDNQKYIKALINASEYFRINYQKIPILVERDYNYTDIKYGLAICGNSGDNIVLQIPLIKGNLTDPGILYNITKRNRDLLYVVITPHGRITSVYLTTDYPTDEFYENNRKCFRYSELTGIKNIYNSTNQFSGQLILEKGKVAQTRSLTDSIFELPEVIIYGVDIKLDHYYNGYCQFCKLLLMYASDHVSMICPQCFYNIDDEDLSGYCLATGSWTIIKGFLPNIEDKHDSYEERNTCSLQVVANIINTIEKARVASAGQIIRDYCFNKDIAVVDFINKMNFECGLKMDKILDILIFLSSENYFIDYYHKSNETEAKDVIKKGIPVFATFESNVVDSIGQATSHAVTLYGYDANGNFCYFDSMNGVYYTKPGSDFYNYIVLGKY